jgi:hypothetical protein
MTSSEQLESAWPVHGSVLVDESLSDGRPVAYVAAGRSCHVDGGIFLYALELATGKVLHRAVADMNAKGGAAGVIAERVLPDVLSVQSGAIFMRQVGFSAKLAPKTGATPHLYAPGGFLDNTWWHRTYWIYGTYMKSAWGGWPVVGNQVPAGRLLVFDGGETIYGYGRLAYRAGGGHVHPDAKKDYKLFAEAIAPKQTGGAAPKPKGRRRRGVRFTRKVAWSKPLPFLARSLVLTPDALVVAGGASLIETAEDHGPGTLAIAARADGAIRGTCRLPAPPVLDGIALTTSGAFVSMIDGRLVCVGR